MAAIMITENGFFCKGYPPGTTELETVFQPRSRTEVRDFCLVYRRGDCIKSVKLSHAQNHENRLTNGLLK